MVLVIDDESIMRDLICDLLMDIGIPSVQCHNSEAVQNILAEGDFELIICDIGMPRLNGVDLMRQVKKINPKMKIICLSGYDSLVKEDLAKIGVNMVWGKPFNPDMLQNQIKTLLSL